MARTKSRVSAAGTVTDLNAKRRALFDAPSSRRGDFAIAMPHRSAKVTSAALTKIADQAPKRRIVDEQWQSRAYELLDEVGELGYLIQLKANLVARCNLIPEHLDETGHWDAADPEEHPEVHRVLAAFVGPQGGQTELKRAAAVHLATAGETHMLGTEVEPEPGTPSERFGLLWEFLSVDELKIVPQGKDKTEVHRFRQYGQREVVDADKSYIARLWRPAARWTDMAESEVKRVMRIAEEILVLTQMVDAIASSQLPAGILFVPDDIEFVDDESDEPAEDSEVMDPFTRLLVEHLSAPKVDPESGASIIPLILRGPAEMGDKIKLIDLSRDMTMWGKELREEALGRMAQGLDAPPEMMHGLSGSNHWNAFAIDADFVSKHIAPLGELLAEFVTFAFARPMLEEFESKSHSEALRYRVRFDLSPIAARQDEAQSAARLYVDDLISDLAMVRAAGFEEGDMPSAEEKIKRRMWELVKASPQVYGPLLLPKLEGFEDVEFPDPNAMPPPVDGGQVPGMGDVGPTQDAQTGMEKPRAIPPGFNVHDMPTGLATLLRTVTVASDAALDRALERAGGKIINQCSQSKTRNVELRDRLRPVKKSRALELITEDELRSINLTVADLVTETEFADLGAKTRQWVTGYLVDQDLSSTDADEHGAMVASALIAALTEYVHREAHSGFSLGANRLKVPDSLVMRAIAPVLLVDQVPAG